MPADAHEPQLQCVWSLETDSQDSVGSQVLRQVSLISVAANPECYGFQAKFLSPPPVWDYRHTAMDRTWAARLAQAAWVMLLPAQPFPHP